MINDGFCPALRRQAEDVGEFDFGAGLVPNGLEDAPPSAGGIYRGRGPDSPLIIGAPRSRPSSH